MGFDFGDSKEIVTSVPKEPLSKKELFDQVMLRLDKLILSGELDYIKVKPKGVRSRQPASVVLMLIEMGIIKEENLT